MGRQRSLVTDTYIYKDDLMSVLKCGKTSICIQFSINVFISNNLAQWILKKYLLLRWVIDFKDAESMYGIRERKKIMEGVQRCFFKNILCKELSTNNSDLGIVKGLVRHSREWFYCEGLSREKLKKALPMLRPKARMTYVSDFDCHISLRVWLEAG